MCSRREWSQVMIVHCFSPSESSVKIVYTDVTGVATIIKSFLSSCTSVLLVQPCVCVCCDLPPASSTGVRLAGALIRHDMVV